jgi:YD repeat-containing protein
MTTIATAYNTDRIRRGSQVVDRAFARQYGKQNATIYTVESIDPFGQATLSYDEWGLSLEETAWLDELETL